MVYADLGTSAAGTREPSVAASRDGIAAERDSRANLRDRAADERDQLADERDRLADERDRLADQRDRVAEQLEAVIRSGTTTDALAWSAAARGHARSDRRQASEDRRAGASGRRRAERDRGDAVTDRAASAGERESAAVDGLTGLYLREVGFAELEREVARARRAAQSLIVAFVDVDGLKAINDAHGHAAGDAMLSAVADTLRGQLRSSDLIFRYGGDEMVCALSGLSVVAATERFALVNAALAATPAHGSVTVGLAQLRRDDSAHDLVDRADGALYRQRQLAPRRDTEAGIVSCATSS